MEHQKRVLITGGAKRVGKAFAEQFAKLGWDVVIHYNQSRAEAEVLCLNLKTQYPQQDFKLIQANLNNADDVLRIFELLEDDKHIDVLINNASVFESSSLGGSTKALFDRQMQVNFNAPFFLMQQFYHRSKRGCIINILDTRIVNNDYLYGAYSLSKKALMHLTQMAALEWAPGMRVNAVAPGPVLPAIDKDESVFNDVVADTPLQRVADIEDLFESVLFLTKNKSITGQILFCDSGSHLKR